MKTVAILMSLMLLVAGVAIVIAQDHEGHDHGTAQEMPPMGPPEEIKAMAHMVGTWESAGKMRMDLTTEDWINYTGTTEYKWICDGAALMSTYKSQMMGMAYVGTSIETYDRETKMYQTTWIDNMSARQSTYLGKKSDGKVVFLGEDIMQGMTFKSRVTLSNMTDTSYNFLMEHSMDGGKTWAIGMDATYTKKK